MSLKHMDALDVYEEEAHHMFDEKVTDLLNECA